MSDAVVPTSHAGTHAASPAANEAVGPEPPDPRGPAAGGDVERFAGGVAHDVNNMLTAIRGFAVLARAELEPDAPGVTDLDQVIAATDRATSLVRELLAFSKARARRLRLVAPGRQARALAPMLRMLVGGSIELRIEDRSEGAVVRTDPVELDQVIVNLALNARDAMPAGGQLGIRTTCLAGEDLVRIEVSDTGDGMDPPTAARVFEPYFTTKGARGTGLGLPNALDVVRAAGGTIRVQSARGRGTTIRVDLPRAVAA